MLIKARYVVPVDSPVIENGGVKIEGNKITAVGPAGKLSDDSITDYGDAVIFPGFVNAHTHLELTNCAGLVPPTSDFTDWLRRLVALTADQRGTREAVEAAVRAGIEQSISSGVTLIGDITRHPAWTRPVLAESSMRCVSFGEVIAIGTVRERLAERLDAALATDGEFDPVRLGVSPHAPYTVEPDGLRACADRAAAVGAPLAIHLAETDEEAVFTHSRSGPFAEHLKALGVWDEAIPTSRCGPIELARRAGLLNPRTVIAHANYVSDADIDCIAKSGASVAYCPRTHDAFGHPPHRFRDMLAAGINVCIGTDSLASNPSLSILDELRFLRRRHPDLDPHALIELGTLRGARALGFQTETGSLTPGKLADLTVVPLEATRFPTWESVLESSTIATPVPRTERN